jgi:hypothetical protein
VSQTFLLVTSGKSEAFFRASPARHEGRFAIVTNVGQEMRWTLSLQRRAQIKADDKAVWS